MIEGDGDRAREEVIGETEAVETGEAGEGGGDGTREGVVGEEEKSGAERKERLGIGPRGWLDLRLLEKTMVSRMASGLASEGLRVEYSKEKITGPSCQQELPGSSR